MSDPVTIAKRLTNLPPEDRRWVMNRLAPETFARWCRQSRVALRGHYGKDDPRPQRSFNEKVRAHRLGQEQLSELAIFEGSTMNDLSRPVWVHSTNVIGTPPKEAKTETELLCAVLTGVDESPEGEVRVTARPPSIALESTGAVPAGADGLLEFGG